MDNFSQQPYQPMAPFQPAQPAQPMQPMQQPMQQPAQPNAAGQAKPKMDKGDIIKIVTIVVVSVIALTFIGLFIWKMMQYNEVKTDVDGQISVAVAEAKDEQAEALEKEFAEREKYPYSSFVGPVDYGEISFEYPKTWSVYIKSDASKGGDFESYFNPGGVNTVSDSTINALRFEVLDDDFESVASKYQKEMDKKDSDLTLSTVTVNGVTANRYSGTLPGTELKGYIVIFKIRDKTAVFRTDSVLFENDFNTLLLSVKFNS